MLIPAPSWVIFGLVGLVLDMCWVTSALTVANKLSFNCKCKWFFLKNVCILEFTFFQFIYTDIVVIQNKIFRIFVSLFLKI